MITTQNDIRRLFWATFRDGRSMLRGRGLSQNQLPADVRQAFCEFVDMLERDGIISETLASKVTL